MRYQLINRLLRILMQASTPLEKANLLEQAGKLVPSAKIFAASAYTPLLERFTILKGVNLNRWDLITTIASVFVALSRLNNLKVEPSLHDSITEIVTKNLMGFDQGADKFFVDCKNFFDKTYDKLKKDDPKSIFISTDAIGAWMTWNILDRKPQSNEEIQFTRTIGTMVTHSFFEWWTSSTHVAHIT